jgi:hypothetical protein
MAVTGTVVGDVGQGPVVKAVAFGSSSRGQLLPGPLRKLLDQGIGAERARTGGDLVVAGNREDVPELPLLQRGPQVRVAPVDLVACHPGDGNPGIQCAADHACGELGLRGEAHGVRNPGGLAAGQVLGPGAPGCGRLLRLRLRPGPQWTEADRKSYAKWQRKLGCTSAAADGWPGAKS